MKKKQHAQPTPLDLDPNALHFVPLGGAEQFGVNLNAYTYGGKWLGVDLGIGFADERHPGIDLLLPDPSLLADVGKDLLGLFVTHAHEDHVGAVPYLLPRLNCPVYCSRFTAKVLRRKVDELGPRDADIRIVSPGDVIRLGPFTIHCVHVAHSIPDCLFLLIDTPAGKIAHSGDWHLDPDPVIGPPTDSKTLRAAGDSGIMAYIGDSTNAEVPGRAGAERDTQKGLEAIFSDSPGRVGITIFSSHIARIWNIAKAAQHCKRKVALVGFSLQRMVEAAKSCGFLQDIPDFISAEEANALPGEKVVMVVTGSQGETRAALSRIARGEHPYVRFQRGDTVIFSSRAIAGNEKAINAVKNNLAATGIRIVSAEDTALPIHISGHPCREEITDMFGWLRPALVVPVHGERTQLEAHADLARACQVPAAIVPTNGSVIRLGPGTPKVVGQVPTALLAIDQGRIIPADHAAIGARHKLQFSGAVHVTIVLDETGKILAEPRITSVGLVDPKHPSEQGFESEIVDEILEILDDMTDEEILDDTFLSEEIRIGVRRFVQHERGMKPKITTHIVRV